MYTLNCNNVTIHLKDTKLKTKIKLGLMLLTLKNQCNYIEKKGNLSIKSIEWLVQASEIQPRHWSQWFTAFCFYSVIQAGLSEKRSADFPEGRLHQQSRETHLTVPPPPTPLPPPPSCPFVLLRWQGLLHLNLFFPAAAALSSGKTGIEIPEDFWVHSMWKSCWLLRLLLCSTSFHLHGSFFPWLLLLPPSAQLILIVLTRFIRLWPGVISVITCWFSPPPLRTVLPCLPVAPSIRCSCFTLAI